MTHQRNPGALLEAASHIGQYGMYGRVLVISGCVFRMVYIASLAKGLFPHCGATLAEEGPTRWIFPSGGTVVMDAVLVPSLARDFFDGDEYSLVIEDKVDPDVMAVVRQHLRTRHPDLRPRVIPLGGIVPHPYLRKLAGFPVHENEKTAMPAWWA